MLDAKTKKMAQFYEQCRKNGYTDMRDETQSLKAKVIAVDLGLDYGRIIDFYAKAEKAYRLVREAEEKEHLERESAIRREEERKARQAVAGELLVTMSDSCDSSERGTVLRVYLRPDGSVYSSINNGDKIEGVPVVEAKKGGIVESSYHPSQLVYTGATVGGITTGGVHQTQASVSEHFRDTGTGFIQTTAGGKTIFIMCVSMSRKTRDAFKRDEAFRTLTSDGNLICYDPSGSGKYMAQASAYAKDYGTRMTMLSMAADKSRLPYTSCRAIADLLNRVVSASFPPSDQSRYERACSLAESSKASDLESAIAIFSEIIDYKDSKSRAEGIRPRYHETLQAEKEAAILEKEKQQEKNRLLLKKLLIIAPVAIAIIVASALIYSKKIAPAIQYDRAASLLADGNYEQAIDQFTEILDYKDSEARIAEARAAQIEKEKSDLYAEAKECFDSGDYFKAMFLFLQLDGYADSDELLPEARYRYASRLLDSGSLETAIAEFSSLDGYKDSKALLENTKARLAAQKAEEEYQTALSKLSAGPDADYDEVAKARKLLLGLGGYKDSERILSEFLYVTIGEKTSNGYGKYIYDSEGKRLDNLALKYGDQKYDRSGRLISSNYTYDDSGRIISEKSSRGILQYEYDENGLLILKHGDSYEEKYSYDRARRLTHVKIVSVSKSTDQSANKVYTTVITKTTNQSYTYDKNGNLASEIVNCVKTYDYGYPGYHDRTERTNDSTYYTYGKDGLLLTEKHSNTDMNGRTVVKKTEYSYDDQQRISSSLVTKDNRATYYEYQYHDDNTLIITGTDQWGHKDSTTLYLGYIWAPDHP